MDSNDAYSTVFGDKSRVLIVFAHPDDAELYVGGTIARLLSDGKRVRVVKMTSGGRGSRQERISEAKLTELREKEDAESMRLLGIPEEDNIYLRFRDGEVTNSLDVISKVVFQIREFQPDLIITHNPENVIIRFDADNSWINHRDHRNTGQSVIDAAYPYSRDLLFYPEQFNEARLKPGDVSSFLLVDYYDHADEISIDITDFVQKRIDAHARHSSQYDTNAAQASADFFTKTSDGKNRERFRYVIAD